MSCRSAGCRRVLAALSAVVVAPVLAAPAEAQVVIGGQLFATGGTVEIVVQPGTAGYTSQLFLLHPDGSRSNVALNTEVGRQVTVGPFAAGQELVFGITPLGGEQSFLMGPGTRNPDGIAHAQLTETGERTFLVGFEDLFGGGDRDYDDTVFQFTGNLAPGTGDAAPNSPPPAVDAPPTTPTPATNPQPDVAPLTIAEARSRLPAVLRKRYGRRYTSRRGPVSRSCYRLSSKNVRCRVGWKTSRHRYAGNVTMWNDNDHPGAMLFTTSIRRTRRATPAP
jgi:hypothetical protein